MDDISPLVFRPWLLLHNLCVYDGDAGDSFDVGHQTYFITIDSSEVHFKEYIYFWVEAHEEDNIYHSANITVLLDKAVKLDPPDLKNLSMEKHGRSLTVHWPRIDRFSESMETRREIKYKVNEHSYDTVQCKTPETRNTPKCVLNKIEDTELPVCKESCTFNLTDDREHYIQIRQKYEEGVWSEWSHSVFIPADIDSNLQASYTEGKLENNGIRTLRLGWKAGKENQGDINYDITLTLLPCPDAKLRSHTKDNWFNVAISGAPYNITIVAFNQAGKTPPWSLMIDEKITGSQFESITLLEKQLIMKWKKKTRKPATYCIEWQPSGDNSISFSNFTRNYESNHIKISTDDFVLMQCYRIRIHKVNNSQHSSVGTAYYFRPSESIGPRNLTPTNIASQSLLLQWNIFDLQMCQDLLKHWEINITDHNTNISRREISSVNQHLVENLSFGFNCTFVVRGVTIYGEYTGRSVTNVFNSGSNIKWLPFLVIAICLLIIGTIISVARTRLRMYLFPDLPDPSKSNVITFVPNDSNYILCPKYLIDTSSENRETDCLRIETKVVIKDTKMIFKEPEIKQVAITSGNFDNDIFVVAEAETDFQFTYKKQMVDVTQGTGNEVLIQEIRKLEDDDLATEAELKENVTFLSVW